jgi:DegV family protein with EDD domain
MQVVTDSATDIHLLEDKGLDNVRILPLKVTLDEKTYRDKLDISADAFYQLLEKSDGLPVTSQPSAGEFAETYRELAKKDKDILSIHMSSGLSGTYNSAVQGAEMVPEANVTVVDTKTLSGASGWQVQAAVQAIKAGWNTDRILEKLKEIAAASSSFYTLKELKYLIHGGRISHIKGLIASMLQIKPLIGVHKELGNYTQEGQARSFNNALDGLVDLMKKTASAVEPLRVQIVHTANMEGAEALKQKVMSAFKCEWLNVGQLSFVLGAHTGPSMVGVGFAPMSVFKGIE